MQQYNLLLFSFSIWSTLLKKFIKFPFWLKKTTSKNLLRYFLSFHQNVLFWRRPKVKTIWELSKNKMHKSNIANCLILFVHVYTHTHTHAHAYIYILFMVRWQCKIQFISWTIKQKNPVFLGEILTLDSSNQSWHEIFVVVHLKECKVDDCSRGQHKATLFNR